jgi:hypothetical protein
VFAEIAEGILDLNSQMAQAGNHSQSCLLILPSGTSAQLLHSLLHKLLHLLLSKNIFFQLLPCLYHQQLALFWHQNCLENDACSLLSKSQPRSFQDILLRVLHQLLQSVLQSAVLLITPQLLLRLLHSFTQHFCSDPSFLFKIQHGQHLS